MFGYVVANVNKLTAGEKQRYLACYCGLCRALGNRHGALSRITLTYDMAFLVLLLSSLSAAETAEKTGRCIMHPLKPRMYWMNEMTDYAADMNVLLAYYKFLDDWTDDKRLLSLWEAGLFKREYSKIVARYPEKCAVIHACLKELSGIERSGELNPDIPANCFGRLMGEIFIFRKDGYTESIRAFAAALGKFIYIMDACIDLKADIKKERYNPLVASSDDCGTVLNLLMGDCTEKYKHLPVARDKQLIENILYSGVWTRYEAARKTPEAHHR
ncbi:MAG: hypothetical protein HZC28_08980 [Spirochaetes bacterium]|nr:hypothetical protein [Spirochaetota bacterium]